MSSTKLEVAKNPEQNSHAPLNKETLNIPKVDNRYKTEDVTKGKVCCSSRSLIINQY